MLQIIKFGSNRRDYLSKARFDPVIRVQSGAVFNRRIVAEHLRTSSMSDSPCYRQPQSGW
jgi:hypothetical protein